MNLLITGGYGYKDLGDEAILGCMIKRLKEEIPDARITVLSHDPEDTFHRHRVRSYYSMAGSRMGAKELIEIIMCLLQSKAFPRKLLKYPIEKRIGNIIKMISSSDLVISGGGRLSQ